MATRFYESVCAIAQPLNPVPGELEAIRLLNTMESMCVSNHMDDTQRTVFVETMCSNVERIRSHG